MTNDQRPSVTFVLGHSSFVQLRASSPMQPALALIEFDSIAAGIEAGDAMAKKAPIARLVAGTVHNGKYLVLISGEVADVEESLAAGLATGASAVLDHVYLPGVHPHVVDAIAAGRRPQPVDALGVIETRTVAAAIAAADAGIKGADGQPARGAPGRWAGRAWPGLLRWPGRRRGGRRGDRHGRHRRRLCTDPRGRHPPTARRYGRQPAGRYALACRARELD